MLYFKYFIHKVLSGITFWEHTKILKLMFHSLLHVIRGIDINIYSIHFYCTKICVQKIYNN